MFLKLRQQLFENFKFHLFIKLFVFYLCVFLIPFLICGVFLSQYVMAGYKDEVLELNSKVNNYIRRMIDQNLADIDVIALQLAENEEIMEFIQRTDMTPQEKPYYVRRAVKTINEYRVYKSTIKEIHLYAQNSDCVITPSAYYTKKEYFTKFLENSGISFEEWARYLENPRISATPMISKFSSGAGSTAVIMRPGARDLNGNIPTLMVVLDAENIVATYSELASSEYAAYFAVTSDKDILIQSAKAPIPFYMEDLFKQDGNMQEADGDYLLFSSKSQNQNLYYVCMMSEQQILKGVRRINLVLVLGIILMAMVLLCLAFVLSNQTFKPIKSLSLFGLGEKTYNFDSVKEFQGFLANIIHSNSQLNETVSRQQEYINHNFFKTFIQNSAAADAKMLTAMFEETGITLKERFFRAAVVEFNETHFDNVDNFNIISGFQDILKNYRIKHSVVPAENGEIVMLLAYDRGDERIQEVFEKVVNHLGKSYHIDAHISVGRAIASVDKFSKSYEDALFGLEKRTQKVSVYDKGSNLSYQEYFSFIKRDKLIYDIRQGDVAAVQRTLNLVMESALLKRSSTLGIQNYICQFLDGILKEVLEAEQVNDLLLKKYLSDSTQIINGQNIKETLKQIERCFVETTQYIKEGKVKRNGDVIGEIIRYVNENYQNPDITLKQISEELGIASYKYISEEFKRKTGMKFIDHLHNVRNNEAKHLLLTTDLKVFEISEKVGYMGANAFVKIFKKLNGITPGKFRQSGRL